MKFPFRRNKTPQQIGHDAQRLLDDPLYSASFEAVEEIVKRALLDAHIESDSDKERVMMLVMRWQAITGAKRWLDNQIQLGRLSEQRTDERELRKIK